MVEKQIDRLIKEDIIEEVKGPTPWVSPIVIDHKKDGDIRICTDMRQANRAIKRSHFHIPTVDKVLQFAQGARFFTQIDLKWGYHQVELKPESRYITAFVSHCGTFQNKRLLFGAVNAAEDFQKIMSRCFAGLKNVITKSDNILLFGKTQEEHDSCLEALLSRMEECGLTARIDKCEFCQEKIQFFGYEVSAEGIKPTHEKVQALQSCKMPLNVKELHSFLGLAGWVLRRFAPQYSTLVEPLSCLTRKGAQWKWGIRQENAYKQIMSLLERQLKLHHFDPSLETRVADASPVGLGALLCQKDKSGIERTVQCISRTLSDVERRYSQTEREALALSVGHKSYLILKRTWLNNLLSK